VPARFMVEEVFEVPQRGLTLAVGQVLDGAVTAGMTLQVEATGATVKVASIELIPPPADNPNRVSLVIDQESETRPARGMVLIAP
jgi:hypothetical protein